MQHPTIQTALTDRLSLGIALQNQGQLTEAEATFRSILVDAPDHPDALHALAILELLRGNAQAALPLLARSLQSRHANAAAFANLCAALRQMGQLDQAVVAGEEAVSIDPNLAMAHHNLAAALLGKDDHLAALAPLRRHIVLVPDSALQYFLLASSLMTLNRYREAEPVWRAALRLAPDDARAHANLAVTLKNLGRYEQAEVACRQALALMPDEPGILSNLGLCLSHLDGRDEEATLWLHRATRIRPDFAEAWINLGLVARNRNDIGLAMAHARTALGIAPDQAQAHVLMATCLLLRGQMREGFAAYEWRVRLRDFPAPTSDYRSPTWTGGDVTGRTVLVHDEQGLGDAIQFVRYALLLARSGARVALECAAPLARLFGTLPDIGAVIPRGRPLPPHDTHVSMMSLPHLMIDADIMDVEIPYLSAETDLARFWARRLAGFSGLKVGLIWAGNPEFRDDRRRSPGLAALRLLLDVPGVCFFALQMGPGRQDLERLAPVLGANITDLGPDITDLADTAAIMANLDLIITSCTSPTHLAGALGCPVWTLLPLNADWRWRDGGDTTGWYPTMRLFRQECAGDWALPVTRIRDALLRHPGRPRCYDEKSLGCQ